jgi:hypothetical protein
MHINDMATVETLDNSIQEIVTAALEAGFRVFAHKREHKGLTGFVFACLDTEGSFVTVGIPTHRWDDTQISVPVQPNKVWGSSVHVDYDGTSEDAVRAMREVCESPTVLPRFGGNVPAVPNYGNKVMTTWPGGADLFAEVTF